MTSQLAIEIRKRHSNEVFASCLPSWNLFVSKASKEKYIAWNIFLLKEPWCDGRKEQKRNTNKDEHTCTTSVTEKVLYSYSRWNKYSSYQSDSFLHIPAAIISHSLFWEAHGTHIRRCSSPSFLLKSFYYNNITYLSSNASSFLHPHLYSATIDCNFWKYKSLGFGW